MSRIVKSKRARKSSASAPSRKSRVFATDASGRAGASRGTVGAARVWARPRAGARRAEIGKGESAKDDLQALNKALRLKSGELSEINAVFEIVLASLEMPLILLDLRQRVVRYTPLAAGLFDLRPEDIGRPIARLNERLNLPALSERAAYVVRSGKSERELIEIADHHYQMRITPYRDGLGHICGALVGFSDVAGLVQAENELRASEQRVMQILDGSPLSKLGVSENGKIVYVNDRATQLFDYTRDELLGKPVEILIPSASHGQHVKERTAYVSDPQRRRMALGRDLVAQRRDGTRFPVEISLNPIRTDRGLMVLCGVVDISDRKRAERALRERAAALDRSNQALKEFAYVASHDLREPLRMITGHLQLLKRRSAVQLDEKAHSYLDYAVEGAKRMQSLITGLLNYSRIGTSLPAFVPVHMGGVLQQVTADLARQIREAGAVVSADELPTVQGDALQCRQLLQNLISNGIKFRSTAPPRIHVSGQDEGERWAFSVRDNGIGIPADHGERVFGVFQRLHTQEEIPGDGLGLAICKRIVEMHGGSIRVQAAPDQGSVFCFTFAKRDV